MASVVIYPTGDGDVSGTWATSPVAGGALYRQVDEVSADNADYITLTTAGGGYALFTFAAPTLIPEGSKITSIRMAYNTKDALAGVSNARAALKIGGSQYYTDSHDPGTLFASRIAATWTTNPATGAAWIWADVMGIGTNPLQQFGIYSSDSNPNISVSWCNLVVTFTPPRRRCLLGVGY